MDHDISKSLRTDRLQKSVKDDESNMRQILTHAHAIEHNVRDHTTDIKKNDLDPRKIAELVKELKDARDTIRDAQEAIARIDAIFEKTVATLEEKYPYVFSETSSAGSNTVEPVQEEGLDKKAETEIAVVSSEDSPSMIAQTTDSVLRNSQEQGRKDIKSADSADSGIALSTGSSCLSLLPQEQQVDGAVDTDLDYSAVVRHVQTRTGDSPSNDLNRQTGMGSDTISVEDNTAAMLPPEASNNRVPDASGNRVSSDNRVSADQSLREQTTSTAQATNAAAIAEPARQATAHRGHVDCSSTDASLTGPIDQAFLQQFGQGERDFLNTRGEATRKQNRGHKGHRRSHSPVD